MKASTLHPPTAAQAIVKAAEPYLAGEKLYRILGENPNSWRRYVKGDGNPTEQKLNSWLRHWHQTKRPPFRLELDGYDGVRVFIGGGHSATTAPRWGSHCPYCDKDWPTVGHVAGHSHDDG